MRLSLSTPTLLAASSLFAFGSTMPFIPREAAWLQPLVRKATYSVVPVDGGPSATAGNGSPGITIIETITQIPAPTTQTIDITEYIVTTQTIEGLKTTETLVITITPSVNTAQVTMTKYSVIDISAPPVTVVITAPASSSPVASTSTGSISSTPVVKPYPSSSSTSNTRAGSNTQSAAPPTTVPSTISSTSSTLLPATTVTSIASSSTTRASSSSFISLSSSSATTPTPISSSQISTSGLFTRTTLATITSSSNSAITTSTSSKSYDDGMWHTHYPAWTATAAPAISVSTPVGDVQTRGKSTGPKALLRKSPRKS